MDVPFYLQPNESTQPIRSLESALQIDMNWKPDEPLNVVPEKSFWQELADAPSEGASFVWDGVEGTWKSAKDTVLGGIDLAKDAVDAAGNKLGSLFDEIKTNMVLMLVGALVIIWIIAKSGILTQVASVALAVK